MSREKQIGKKYNYIYLPSNDSLYCSKLIYKCFKDNKNNPLFTGIPMNFKNKEGNYPQYWIELYKKLNMDIPQGKMGTNPHQMMKS